MSGNTGQVFGMQVACSKRVLFQHSHCCRNSCVWSRQPQNNNEVENWPRGCFAIGFNGLLYCGSHDI